MQKQPKILETKIGEKVFEQDGKLVVQEKHDFSIVAERAKALASSGLTGGGDNRLVGLVPMKLWHEWAKKWGVKPSDTKAMREVVARELADRDNAQFRVWGGTF